MKFLRASAMSAVLTPRLRAVELAVIGFTAEEEGSEATVAVGGSVSEKTNEALSVFL